MYYFKYSERLSKNKKLMPTICFGYELESNNKSMYDMLVFFDNLSSNAKKELNKIFEYSKNFSLNGINKDTWIRYVCAYKITIPAMSKRITRDVPKIEKGSIVSVQYAEDKKEKELNFFDYETIFPSIPRKENSLFEGLIKHNKQGATITLTIHKEGTYENDIQLLYMVLECLFSSNVPYYIKICELCNKYYVNSLPNKQYCNRMKFVYDIQTTCNYAIDTLYKSKEYKRIIRKDTKYLKYFHNNPTKYDIDKYNDEKNEIKKECIKKLNMSAFEDYIDNFYNTQK